MLINIEINIMFILFRHIVSFLLYVVSKNSGARKCALMRTEKFLGCFGKEGGGCQDIKDSLFIILQCVSCNRKISDKLYWFSRIDLPNALCCFCDILYVCTKISIYHKDKIVTISVRIERPRVNRSIIRTTE